MKRFKNSSLNVNLVLKFKFFQNLSKMDFIFQNMSNLTKQCPNFIKIRVQLSENIN